MLPLSPRLILLLTRRSQQEGRNLFVAYVGALCIQSGYNIVQDWINQLLEPSEKRVKNEPPPMSVPSPLPQQVGAPPDISAASRARLFGQFGPGTPTFSQPNPRPSQPSPAFMSGTTSPSFSNNGQFSPQPAGQPQPPPPPPTTKPPPLPPVPNQQISYLPLFNQTASQRRLGVEYTAQFFGPPHAGKWHVKCLGKLVPAATTWRLSGSRLCLLTIWSISPQLTASKRVKAPDRANSLPRRRLPNRPSTQWGGQPRFVSVSPDFASILTNGCA